MRREKRIESLIHFFIDSMNRCINESILFSRRIPHSAIEESAIENLVLHWRAKTFPVRI